MKKFWGFYAVCVPLCFICGRYCCKKKRDRYYQWYKTLYQWIMIRQDKIKVAEYFKKNNYEQVAIYGMGELGRLLVRELNDSDIEIPFTIDQNAGNIAISGIKVISLKDINEKADVIVVTVIDKFDSIKADIKKYVDVPVVSLDDVLFSL